MQRIIVLLFIFINSIFVCFGQGLIDSNFFRQKVKKVSVSDGKTYYYDTLGRFTMMTGKKPGYEQTLEHYYGSNDSLNTTVESWIRKDRGKIIEKGWLKLNYFYHAQKKKSFVILTTNVELIEPEHEKSEDITHQHFIYDENGHLIRTQLLDSSAFYNKFFYENVYYVNGSDHLPDQITTKNNLTVNGLGTSLTDELRPVTVEICEYDHRGRLVKKYTTYANYDAPVHCEDLNMEYDANGRLISLDHKLNYPEESCNTDTYMERRKYNYTYVNNQLVKMAFEWYTNGITELIETEYFYNKAGLVIMEITNDSKVKPHKTKVKYKYWYY